MYKKPLFVKAMAGKFFIHKDSAGRYRWVGSHTNSFIDLDGEIITSDAHRQFMKQLDSGAIPMPPLFLCHNEKWKVASTDILTVDEVSPGVVFVLASGPFDDGMDIVAEKLSKVPVAMSHGLYVLETGEFNEAVTIDSYATVEISALPVGVSSPANPRTYYIVEESMGILDNLKRGKLAELLGEDTVDAIEAANKDITSKAMDENVQFKDSESDKEAEGESAGTEVTTEGATEEDATDPDSGSVPDAVTSPSPGLRYVTHEELQQFAALVGEGLADEFSTVVNGITTLSESMKALKEDVERLNKQKETPSAALPAYTQLLKAMASDGHKKTGEQTTSVKEQKNKGNASNGNPQGPINFIYSLMEDQNDDA